MLVSGSVCDALFGYRLEKLTYLRGATINTARMCRMTIGLEVIKAGIIKQGHTKLSTQADGNLIQYRLSPGA